MTAVRKIMRAMLSSNHSFIVLGFLCLAPAASTAAGLPVERAAARPSKHLESIGRRASILGRQDGTFEAWVYPVKLIRDFRIWVYIDNALEPVAIDTLAETIESRPGRASVTHVHPAFTITRHWVVAPDRPAATVLLDIETSRPLRLRVTFTPEMKPMWPASFGGQSTWFDSDAKVMRFSEGLRRFRPVLGSPLFSRASEQIGHQMPDRTIMLEMDIPRERAARGPVPVIIAGSKDAYDAELNRVDGLAAEVDQGWAAYAGRTLALEFPGLGKQFDQARFAIASGWACTDGVGCGLVAGWARSGLSERPGFGWYFGGDAMMSAWAMGDVGDFDGARDALQFLIDHSREDGKVMHELTQSAALLRWSDYPYGFYHADTTPLMLFTAARYVRQSGDRAFLERNWAFFEKGWRLCLSMREADGLLSNERFGAAAVETGALSGKVKRDVYLQGVWLGGAEGFRQMAKWMGKRELETQAEQVLSLGRATVSQWFNESRGYFAFAELKDGTKYEANSGWQGFLAANGGVTEDLARRTASALASPTLRTPWGTRMFATDSPFYDPLGYNDGSVWPFVTAQCALAMFRHGQAEAAFGYVWGMARATGLAGPGLLTEFLSGDRFAEGPRSVPHQLFSSVALIHPLISGVFGLEGDAMEGLLSVDPKLPRMADPVKVAGYRVGRSIVSALFRSDERGQSVDLTVSGPALKVVSAGKDAGLLSAGRPLSLKLPASGYAMPVWRLQPGQKAR